MFNLNEKIIKSLCASSEVFKRGERYYSEGRISDIRIDQRNGHVDAVVSGTDDYSVSVDIFPNGEIDDYECECPAYYQYEGCCKHIVSVLLYLAYMKEKTNNINRKKIIDLNDVRQGSRIISFFENRTENSEMVPVSIEPTLEFTHGYEEISCTLSLRIGINKLYVVKNIKDFIHSMLSGQSCEFGKGFAFDPSINCFKGEDKLIMDFIGEIYELDSSFMKNTSLYNDYEMSYIRPHSIFKGKYLTLPRSSVERLLYLFANKPFIAIVKGREYRDVKIMHEKSPVDFLLKKSGNDLVLNVGITPDLVPITSDMKYMFLNGIIYYDSDSQISSLSPFYRAISETGKTELRFPLKDITKFASFVFPSIKKTGKLTLDNSIEKFFCEEPLKSSVYLDKTGSEIMASLRFNYGEYSIDPFEPDDQNEKESIIIRDLQKEKQVLDIFELYGFKVKRGIIYLDDDDSIYNFITEGTINLQKICDVYYSDSFKMIKLYNPSSYKSSIQFNEKSDLLEFNFSIDGIDPKDLPGVFASLKQKKKYHHLSDGSFIPLVDENIKNLSRIMEYLDLKDEDLKNEVINLPKFKAMYLNEKLKEFDSFYVERGNSFKKLVENIQEPKNTDYTVPERLKNIMRGYQVTGFKWLKTLSSYGLGGILADDMGLGKTLETIAFIESEKGDENQPSLVVCPTSLLYNWESEVKKFAPSLKTAVVSGNRTERENIIEKLNGDDIVITSYPLIRRDIDCYRNIPFKYCVLDEAQHIKNPGSISAKSVKEIQAKNYFALTGTPIENNLTELWSIFDFLMPGYLLPHKRFTERFEKPIIAGNDTEALQELNRYVKPFILRRLKKDVLKELPPKIESILTAELTDEQKKIYLAYLETIGGKIQQEIRDKGFDNSHIEILAGLTRLRQICCHPSLFVENYSGGSGKMDMLMEILDELKEGNHRVLLFSQFTGVLNLIREKLDSESVPYFYLYGSTKADVRSEMVNSFNEGFRDIFLISLKAGGTGLNLTGADTVIHFDPWWNPAVEDQATDRAYRIGQENSVQVIKLITKGTIEEKIYELQQKKRALINSVLQPGETFISKMTVEDIMELFKIQ